MSASQSLFRFIVLPHFFHDIVRSSNFLVPRVHALVDFTMKTTPSFSDFCFGFVHVVLHVLQQGTSLIWFVFFFFTKLFKCFPDDAPFVVLLLFVVCGDFCRLLLFQVCVCSFKADSSASIKGDILPFSLIFRGLHLSCKLCPASSTADDRHWCLDLGFQSFLDHPACPFGHGPFQYRTVFPHF